MSQSIYKHILTGLTIVLGSTGISHASLNNAQPGLVTIPSLSAAYEVTASLLWLQPTTTSLDYGIHTQPLPAQNPNWVIQTINPDYELGFDVGVGYVFPCSANDVQFNWSHLKESKAASNSVSGSDFVGPFFEIGPDTGLVQPIQSVAGNTKFRYNRFILDFGQFIYLGCRMETRLFTGLSGVFINNHVTSTFSGDTTDPIFSMSLDNISKYAGMGPRFGMGTRYRFTKKISLIAQIAGNAYLGRMRTALESVGTSAALSTAGISANPQSINANNTNRLVPSADGKLGLDYCFTMRDCTSIKIEAGYQFATFIDAIRSVYPTTLAEIGGNIVPIQTGGIFVGTMGQSQSNFSVNGPYLNAMVKF